MIPQTVRTIDPNHQFYTSEELERVQRSSVPKHIALIPDGNRRWAQNSVQDNHLGHWQGADTLMDFVLASSQLGVEFITVYGFSTENWKRSDLEVSLIMGVLRTYIEQLTEAMVQNGISLQTVGDLQALPLELQKAIARAKEVTSGGKRITLIFALNYGSRNEIVRAAQSLCSKVAQGSLALEDISEKTFGEALDSSSWPDPDLLIRASGEMRLSNFLLWQLSYSEIYVTDVLWPDFTPKNLLQAVQAYQQREQRRGS